MVLPSLPRKQIFGSSFDKAHLESRCRSLESFIQRVVGTEALVRRRDVLSFLGYNGGGLKVSVGIK